MTLTVLNNFDCKGNTLANVALENPKLLGLEPGQLLRIKSDKTLEGVEQGLAQWNANKLQGYAIPSTQPGFMQALAFDKTLNNFKYKSLHGIVNVLDFIPSSEHEAIVARTSNLDVSSYINAAIASLAGSGGTLAFPDGTYVISSPIILLKKVHLIGHAKTSRIKARSDFAYTGTAFPTKALIKSDLDDTAYAENFSIERLTLDGANIAEYGIEIIRSRFSSVQQLDFEGCTLGGVTCGSSSVSTTYEVKFENLWIWRTDVLSSISSVGFNLRNTTDCFISKIITIGYYIGFRSHQGSGGNQFLHCHPWNRPVNGSLKYCFWCGGKNDTYNSCYADTPIDGMNAAYGFYVDSYSQKIVNSLVFVSPQAGYGQDNTVIGIFCSTNSGTASNCVFACNNFVGGSSSMRLAADFGGQFFLAVLTNNRTENCVSTQPDRSFRGISYTTGGNTSAEILVRDTGASFLDNYFGISPYPSGNNSTSATVPGSTNKAYIQLFRQTSTTGEVALEIYDGAATFNNNQRLSTNIAHRFSGNAQNPSYLGIYQNIGMGTRSPGCKLQVFGGLAVSTSDVAAADPGAGNLSLGGGVINFLGTTSNLISFNGAGLDFPTLSTRSLGTKLLLRSGLTATSTDFAIGIGNGTFWQSIPVSGTSQKFSWYAAATEIASLRGDGLLTLQKLTITSVNAWTAPTLQNTWSNFGAPYANAGYRKLPDGTIELKGLIKKATVPTANEIIFNLPALHRPIEYRVYSALSNNGVGRIDVLSNGDVIFGAGSNVWISLDGIRFVAEQ